MKRRHEEPRRIGSIVEEVLAGQGYLTVCREYDIFRKWPDIVDARFAEVDEA